MAAPSGTKWGSIKSGGTYTKGRIGIYVSTSNTSSTITKASVQVWFWSIYSIKDVKNTLYLSNNSSSATKSRGNVSISTTVNSGGGWSTSNQQKLGTWTFEMSRKESKRTINVAAKLSTIDVVGSSMTVSTSYTVPARPKYTLTYNANGGTDAPEAQTLPYEIKKTISDEIPFRDGYTFKGWSKSNTATSAEYSPGGSISITSDTTLYAVWGPWGPGSASGVVDAVFLTYNLNGGEGVVGRQMGTAGSSFTITSVIPTKENCIFQGWTINKDGSGTVYPSKGSITLNASTILYAKWTETRVAYTITYDANGGVQAPAAQTKQSKKILKLTSAEPTRTGYVFRGWGTAQSKDSEEFERYYPGNYYYEDASITLYAIWADASKICLTGGGNLEAITFSEWSQVYGFAKGGMVFAPKFQEVEEGDIQLQPTVIKVDEIIEI